MIHLQQGTDGWLDAVRRLPDGSLVKTVDNGQAFAEVKAINPKINTVLRHWYDPGQVFGGSYEANKARARDFFNSFIDGTFRTQIAQHCDYIEEWNEYLANSQSAGEIQERVTWARAAADVWLNEYRTEPGLSHIKLVLCNTAVGNDIHRDFAVVARDFDAIIGYHPYSGWGFRTPPKTRWGSETGEPLDWQYLSGRWDAMEQNWGIKVTWAFTEAGPFATAVDGWMSDSCLDGDRNLYVESMRTWIKEIQDTSAYQEGRIIGFALFTTDRPNDGTWKTFRTAQPELNLLADMVAEEWKPGQAPVQPVLAEGIDISRWQGTMDWSIANGKVDFAIYKATDGLSWIDPQFVANSTDSAVAVKGPYHFFRPHTDGDGQATHFLNTINGHDFNVLVVDVEYGPIDHDELLAFMRAVREVYPSTRFLLYTSPGFYGAFLRGTDWSEYTELWIAHWNVQQPIVPEPYETWAIWQYTSLGNGAEYGADSTYIDLNVFNGSRDDLIAWASDSPQPIRMIRAITNAKLRTKPYYTGQRGEDTYLLTVPEGHLMEWVGQEQGEEYQGSTVWNKINTWYRYNTSATGIVATTAYIHSELTEPA